MEKTKNRKNFYKDYDEIDIKDATLLPDRVIRSIKSDDLFTGFFEGINFDNWPIEKKLSFVLLELTKKRTHCNRLIKAFERFGVSTIANILSKHNNTNQVQVSELEWVPHIEIDKVIAPDPELSQAIHLISLVRGYFIIVNNLEKTDAEYESEEKPPGWKPRAPRGPEDLPPATGMRLETDRFKDLFTQLNFEVLDWQGMNIDQLKTEIEKLKKDKRLLRHEVIALMIVTHGQDESILGYDACDYVGKVYFRRKFGTSTAEFEEQAFSVIDRDRAPFNEIVDLFTGDNFPQMKDKPKLLFFTACRVKSDTTNQQIDVRDKPVFTRSDTSLAVYQDNKLFISFTSLEGYPCLSLGNSGNQITVFGQALSYSLARHACDESLLKIIGNRVPNLMNSIGEELNKIRRARCQDELDKGCFICDIKLFKMKDELYFNPGFFEEEDETN